MNIFTLIVCLKIILICTGIFTLFFLFFSAWAIFSIIKTGVPFAKTPNNNINIIFSELNLPTGAKIYDLGCGDGEVLFTAEKLGLVATGYELAIYPYLKSRLKKYLINSQVKIFRKNFFLEKINDADTVFVFLVNTVMKKTGDKLKKELKPNTVVVSYGFELPEWKIEKIIETKPSKTYIYKV